jgi:hypothetical protein
MPRRMKAWPVQDAKAHFSEMLDDYESDGPQMVTRRGADAAVCSDLYAGRSFEVSKDSFAGQFPLIA